MMDNDSDRGFIPVAWAAVAILLSVFGISIVSVAMGWWVNILTLLLLLVMGFVFLSKAVDLFAVSDNPLFPSLLGLSGALCFVFALWLVNPGLFSGSIQFSIIQSGAPGSAIQPLSVAQWFSVVPVSESIMANMNIAWLWAFVLLGIGALAAVIFIERK